jgi:5-methylcytosine-specific restriction endonuclease McrBC GTP-binding regulatory subunit McrB
MVLLDELNLAHPELYFAEFLSKLETRRGERGRDVPSIEVKLGSGMEPHQIPLGRNVLWVGTMNQDETTKSLSDKVLDRSIIVPFPRPRRLQRRPELKPSTTAAPLLKRTVWHTWLTHKSTHTAMPQQYEAEMSRIKGSMERINGALSSAGRAIGHRVWQSIEYYLANYPDTRAASTEAELKDAMRNALEDQVVQKIIPKVRGVDTSGSGMRDCLQPIQTEFANMGYDDVVEDFKRSCGAGYGQFMWQSEAFLSDFDAESGADEA